MRGKPWLKSEIDFIKNSWGKISIKDLAEKLNRSRSSIKTQMTRENRKAGNTKKSKDKIKDNKLNFKLIKDAVYEVHMKEENPHFNMKRRGMVKKNLKFLYETEHLYIFETKVGYKECISKNTPNKEIKIKKFRGII